MFRDGVSEGEYAAVAEKEVACIKGMTLFSDLLDVILTHVTLRNFEEHSVTSSRERSSP